MSLLQSFFHVQNIVKYLAQRATFGSLVIIYGDNPGKSAAYSDGTVNEGKHGRIPASAGRITPTRGEQFGEKEIDEAIRNTFATALAGISLAVEQAVNDLGDDEGLRATPATTRWATTVEHILNAIQQITASVKDCPYVGNANLVHRVRERITSTHRDVGANWLLEYADPPSFAPQPISSGAAAITAAVTAAMEPFVQRVDRRLASLEEKAKESRSNPNTYSRRRQRSSVPILTPARPSARGPVAPARWIARFVDKPPAKLTATDPLVLVRQLCSRLAAVPTSATVHVLAIERTLTGNLVITFTATTPRVDIASHLPTIQSALGVPEHNIVSADVAWSKMTLGFVPTCPSPTEPLFDEATLLASLRLNPSFTKLPLAYGPRWLRRPDDMADQAHSTVSLGFEDPDGSVMKGILKADLFLMGGRVRARR
ncbi:uncharacterized protein LAESUDRAFT_711788 [Laetiporus sulphureus 93-53]|uniref:Uncharacterized protein n=1 Tax=Laetiporus sulphureus 93-53 TaxID=1314785 RepID=A0A165G732_9APHY|nr:uncharacterized protein LAESUDRAFT_711788 [Laetiporus sulphureus 93-53]KZT09918.1 hypothetical protein LAESUDRAFT_711788 [Laetiporus sulphureus 93-53]